MVFSRGNRGRRTSETRARSYRRLLFAFAVSMLLHIGIALLMRPSYQPVSDFALDFEVIEVKPGPPPKKPVAPSPEPAPEEPKPEEPKPEPKDPKPKAPPAPTPEVPSPSSHEIVAIEDPETPGATDGRDAGTGSGICMHNLFDFSSPDPDWLLYVSVASFRGTAYEKDLGDTFSSFEIGRRLEQMTGMSPSKDIEALFVGAEDIFDWRTFQVAVSYDGGEEKLEREIRERQRAAGLEWQKTDDGLEAAVPGQFRFHLVGSGRVLVIRNEPSRPLSSPDLVQKLPKNPYRTPDGGTPPLPEAGETDTKPPEPERAPEKVSEWPSQVTCIKRSDERDKDVEKKERNQTADLLTRARALITPDGEGHWPVAVLATRDPRAVGLGVRQGRRIGFRHAVVRGYFSDPVRIEGVLTFSGNPDEIEALAAGWRRDAERYARDFVLVMAGVSPLLKNLEITAAGNTITVSLKMREQEVLSTLLFLQLQGKSLEQQLKSN